ncbi:helix-turn-helix domain-containing protein [Mycobacteroides chelonae]|uniref:hypothetical protein n=1 Tax=Mycobacteroides chelonae TaxID=1774 RepID=UPI00104208DD|nr:hypothetical protein [Mycobacteroides chelonae]
MSDGPWLKFRYYEAVYAQSGLSMADKGVLGFAAIMFVHGDGDTFCRRQETVAARAGTNVRTVQRAYKRGIELGLLELVTERQRGRGHKRADEYRIRIPAGYAGTPEIDDTVSGIPLNTRHTVQKYPTLCPEIPDILSEKIASTSTDEAPKVLCKGSLGKDAATPPPAPLLDDLGQPRCRKHFGIEFPPDCRPCGRERERDEALTEYQRQHRQAELTAIWAVVRACDECDPSGLVWHEESASHCDLHPHPSQIGDVA